MPDELLSDRVERLENTVEGLQRLPADVGVLSADVGALSADVAALGARMDSVETQIVQLRIEMRSEFSDVRNEMREGFASARDEMLVGLANVRSELGRQIQKTAEDAEEGRRHSRALFEEVLGRITMLGEHRGAPSGRKPPERRRKG